MNSRLGMQQEMLTEAKLIRIAMINLYGGQLRDSEKQFAAEHLADISRLWTKHSVLVDALSGE